MSKLTDIILAHLPKERKQEKILPPDDYGYKHSIDQFNKNLGFNSCLAEIKKALPDIEKEIVEIFNKRIEKYKNDPTLSDRTKVALIVEYEYLLTSLTK